MERLPSLINSLKQTFDEGGKTGDLLMLVEQLRNELIKTGTVSSNSFNNVSVWLPSGYAPLIVNEPLPSEKSFKDETMHNEAAFEHNSAALNKQDLLVEIDNEIGNADLALKLPDNAEGAANAFLGVPRPPHFAKIQFENEDDSLVAKDDFVLPGNYHVQPSNRFQGEAQSPSIINEAENEINIVAESPVFWQLDMPSSSQSAEKESFSTFEKQGTATEDRIGFKTQLETKIEEKPKELHEILAKRVVATPNQILNQPKVLADTLSGTKIADIKKGIAINDRFRFINSLFRGDESLFERSLKTINNFNILQEAQYWIQRELVIKFGWNEDDELVQQFFHLVNRRFL